MGIVKPSLSLFHRGIEYLPYLSHPTQPDIISNGILDNFIYIHFQNNFIFLKTMLQLIFSEAMDHNISYSIGVCFLLAVFAMMNVAILIFLRKNRIASSNTMVLVRIQTCLDVSFILISPISNLREQDKITSVAYATFYCYVIRHPTFFQLFAQSSLHFTVLLSLDRFVCIVMPFRYKSVTKRRTYLAILAAILTSFLFLAGFIYNMKTVRNIDDHNMTEYRCFARFSVTASFSYIVCRTCLPFVTSTALNAFSIIFLVRSCRKRLRLNATLTKEKKANLIIRYSLANILSTFSYGMLLFFVLFYKFLISKNMLYDKCIYCIVTVVNPIVYTIMFRNFRRFVICQ